jgi:hypothetical protein
MTPTANSFPQPDSVIGTFPPPLVQRNAALSNAEGAKETIATHGKAAPPHGSIANGKHRNTGIHFPPRPILASTLPTVFTTKAVSQHLILIVGRGSKTTLQFTGLTINSDDRKHASKALRDHTETISESRCKH